jgi:prepilin-type N-terminal cleavage/methylation domain-containing protein
VRKGFTLIELLVVVVVIPVISFALVGIFGTVITDIPRSYRIIQTNTTLLNMLEQMRDDIIAARGLPESFGRYAANDGLLLIEVGDAVVSYMVMDDKVFRYSLTAADESKVENTAVWSVPHAQVKWELWRKNGRGYAVQVETHIEHKVRGHWGRKMANSHLYFVGALK